MNISNDLLIGIAAGLSTALILLLLNRLIKKIITFRREINITGVYDCEYSWPDRNELTYERIFFLKLGKKYYGYGIKNSSDLKFRQFNKPTLRVQGELFLLKSFTGWWYHPISSDFTRGGSLDMNLDFGELYLSGTYKGWSGSRGEIVAGDWKWKKNNSVNYGLMSLSKELLIDMVKNINN